MKENNPHILGTEKVGKLLLEYSIPAIIGMTLTSLYNIIDSVFIGHGVGAMAISGLAISFPLMNLLVAFCTLVGVGGATISSIRLGQKDTDGAEKVLGNVTVLCVINSIFYGGITLLFLAERVARELTIPVIGIGAGGAVDGQVLVVSDMLGMTNGFSPRFLRRYADLHTVMTGAIQQYVDDVKKGDFPNEDEQY